MNDGRLCGSWVETSKCLQQISAISATAVILPIGHWSRWCRRSSAWVSTSNKPGFADAFCFMLKTGIKKPTVLIQIKGLEEWRGRVNESFQVKEAYVVHSANWSIHSSNRSLKVFEILEILSSSKIFVWWKFVINGFRRQGRTKTPLKQQGHLG